MAVILLVVVAAGIGVSLYNAAIAARINQAVQQAVESGQPVTTVPAYGPWHGLVSFVRLIPSPAAPAGFAFEMNYAPA